MVAHYPSIHGVTSKVCAKCGTKKPLNQFGVSSKNRDGLQSRCKTCRQEDCRAARASKYRPALPLPDCPGVEFRAVAGFDGYCIADDGRVWSTKESRGREWRPMTPGSIPSGHLFVHLRRDGKRHSRYVHHLVLEAFVGPCPEGMEACHFPDRDPTNNREDNLRWDTRAGNAADQRVHGTVLRGEAHGNAKLNDEVVRLIRRLRGEGARVMEISRRTGIEHSQVRSVINWKTWGHVV